jgi:DNA primase
MPKTRSGGDTCPSTAGRCASPTPEKAYFSRDVKLSKLDVVRYYLSVARGALAVFEIVP